jgi:autotransporter-associated beta strand protein
LSGNIVGIKASLTKVGDGVLTLGGVNNFGVSINTGLNLNGGTVQAGGPNALHSGLLLNFNSGTLDLNGNSLNASFLSGPSGTITDNSGNFATTTLTINQIGSSTVFGGTINNGPSGLIAVTKTGNGVLTLTGNNTYSGATNVTGGSLILGAGGVINSTTAGGSQGGVLQVDGGTLTSSALTTINGAGFLLSNGSASFNGGIRGDANDGNSIRVTGGSFNAASVTLQRSNSYGTVAPGPTGLAALTTTGFYVSGGTSTLGSLTIGTSNSSSSARIDGGDVTVSGRVLVGFESNTRYNILQVNGGTFTSTDPFDGLVLGQVTANANLASEVLLTGGVTTVEKIGFGSVTDPIGGAVYLIVNGGTLYVGSGGMVQNNLNLIPNVGSTVFLTSGTIGAKADWSTPQAMQFSGGAFTLQTADATGLFFNITLTGDLSGGGSLNKTGGGILTLGGNDSYAGATDVAAGTLVVNGALTGTLGTTLHSGTTLMGSGSLAGPTILETGSIHAPGNPVVGTEVFDGNLTYQTGSTFKWDLLTNSNATAGTEFDRVIVRDGLFGASNLTTQTGVALQLAFNSSGSSVNWTDPFWDTGRDWTLIDYSGTGASTGVFDSVQFGTDSLGQDLAALRPTGAFSVANVNGDLVLTYAVVPEPGAAAMLLGGLGLLIGYRRRHG